MVRLAGKSTVVEIDVAERDMPNFFVEAVAVHSGKMHTVVREIFVPPAKRVFDVAVEPSAKEYLPGEQAKVKFKLTGSDGKPIVGSTVVAVYDKALDYIAGGQNVPDIREFFWKWRRSHQSQGESNLNRGEGPVAKPNEKQMQNLGVFGESVADDEMRGRRGDIVSAVDFAAETAPLAAAAPMEEKLGADASGGAAGAPPTVEPVIRQNFADTALWVGSLETDAEGVGQVECDAGESYHVESERVGNGPRHARRRRLGRSGHPQEHHRAAAGAAIFC
jgi:hypothetical protein